MSSWAPPSEYLPDLLRPYAPSYRSTDQSLLVVLIAKRKHKGGHAFSVAAPNLWNELPELPMWAIPPF